MKFYHRPICLCSLLILANLSGNTALAADYQTTIGLAAPVATSCTLDIQDFNQTIDAITGGPNLHIADVDYICNINYDISVSSQFGNLESADGTTAGGYTITFAPGDHGATGIQEGGGSGLPGNALTSPQIVTDITANGTMDYTGSGQMIVPLLFHLNASPSLPAGLYTDVITITLSPGTP